MAIAYQSQSSKKGPRPTRNRCRIWALGFVVTSFLAIGTYGQTYHEGPSGLEGLFSIGQKLWDELAPEEIKEEYEFPTTDRLQEFLADLANDLESGSPDRLAAYADEAQAAIPVLRQIEGGDALADWLEPRIDFLVAAEQIEQWRQAPSQPPPAATPPTGQGTLGSPPATPKPIQSKPQYSQEYWTNIMGGRPLPKLASKFAPIFKSAFAEQGVPTELIWLSEVESSMNPDAKSPVGAKGPFQFMPATAERFGLSADSPDERTNPERSAYAAASYLKILYRQFKSWPLALAAYNAGEGRVGRTLKAVGGVSFEDAADRLPTETRMYVPKVLATVAVREAINPNQLPPVVEQ